jgi:hypothetical protein
MVLTGVTGPPDGRLTPPIAGQPNVELMSEPAYLLL